MLFSLIQLVVSQNHWCAAQTNPDYLFCIGRGEYGRLGQESEDNIGDDEGEVESMLPVKLPSDFQLGSVFVGNFHTCVLSQGNSTLLCFGRNSGGQLGYESSSDRGDGPSEMGDFMTPAILGDGFEVIRDFCAAGGHSCVMSMDRKVKCFGGSSYGALGYGDTSSKGGSTNEMGNELPDVQLGQDFMPDRIFCNYENSCAVNAEGAAKCWGRNDYGQLAIGETGNRGDDPDEMGDALPFVELGEDFAVQKVSPGQFHICFLSTAGKMKCAGRNNLGQLGIGNTETRGDTLASIGSNLAFVDMGADFVIKDVSSGWDHNCALSYNSTVKCFGRNERGQLGVENDSPVGDEPEEMGSNLLVADLGSDFTVQSFTCGRLFNCALSTRNDIKCFGRNKEGQLAQGHTSTRGDDSNEMGDKLGVAPLPWPPTSSPSVSPSLPSASPSYSPSSLPSSSPSFSPSLPSVSPSSSPSVSPSSATGSPSSSPSSSPSFSPSVSSSSPSAAPSAPSSSPSSFPSRSPSSFEDAPNFSPSSEQASLLQNQPFLISTIFAIVLVAVLVLRASHRVYQRRKASSEEKEIANVGEPAPADPGPGVIGHDAPVVEIGFSPGNNEQEANDSQDRGSEDLFNQSQLRLSNEGAGATLEGEGQTVSGKTTSTTQGVP